MDIRIKHGGRIITSLPIDQVDLIRDSDTTTVLMVLYKKYYGIDVGHYGIKDVHIDKKSVTLNINDEDLAELRNRKIGELGI